MKKYIYILLLGLIIASCSAPKDIAYFQDRQPGTSAPAIIRNSTPFKVRPGDRVSIFVKSRNEKLSQQFNMYGSNNNSNSMGMSQNQYGYLVDENGEIDFPVLGKLKIAGMNRKEITDYLTNTLRDSKLVDDAIVKVEYTGLYVTILGEGGGKRINIDKDQLTFFELLAQMGDIDINGLRKNVLVIREEDGVRSQYEIDLTKMQNVYDSPAYYVHQNDIVYIEPNDKTKRNSTVNGNLFQTWGFWTGLTGLGMTIYSIINLLK
ncbi:MAG: polysaccharide biosynthesis/export family protein [Prevotellaceae bacterium]|nr:polysaccharide biosynthesis/export family protein [Prevotellaceae bacterium]